MRRDTLLKLALDLHIVASSMEVRAEDKDDELDYNALVEYMDPIINELERKLEILEAEALENK